MKEHLINYSVQLQTFAGEIDEYNIGWYPNRKKRYEENFGLYNGASKDRS